MALKNKQTKQYLKADFGLLPQPLIKIFRNKEARDSFNPTFDKYELYPFDIAQFNEEIKTATPDSNYSLVDNFKRLLYAKLKQQLNIPIKSIDEDGNEIEVENIIWEDC